MPSTTGGGSPRRAVEGGSHAPADHERAHDDRACALQERHRCAPALHENEQITYILEGSLKFLLGADGEREVIVRAGEVLVIPSFLPHSAVALEDTLDMDVFNPPRQDWLAGTDSYLRR